MDYRSVECLYCPHTYRTKGKEGPSAIYDRITFDEIVRLAKEPGRRPKDRAPFFIPSDYRAYDARSHAPQRERGQFWYLTLDVDESNLPAEIIQRAIRKLIGDDQYMVYSTSSAEPQIRKWRGLIPLATPLAGADFEETQDAFFDLLEETDERIRCDRALARTGQPVYLPNVPQDRRDNDGAPLFYEHYVTDAQPLELLPDHPIIVRRGEIRAEQAEIAAETAMAREALAKQHTNLGQGKGGLSPIEAFNKENTISSLLQKYRYAQNGGRDCWQSCYQTSGSFATNDFGTHWVSHSESDRQAGVGHVKAADAMIEGRIQRKRQRTYCWGDAFDLFVHYEHDGDFDAAIAAIVSEQRRAAIPQLSIVEALANIGGQTNLDDTAGHINGMAPSSSTNDGAAITDSRRELPPLVFQTNDADAMPDLSDDHLAIELGQAGFDMDARYVKQRGIWLFWDGRIWVFDKKNASMTFVRNFLRAKGKQLLEWAAQLVDEADKDSQTSADKALKWAKNEAKRLRSKERVAAVLTLATSNSPSAATPEQFDTNLHALATPVGTVDLKSGELREARREDLATKMTSVGPAKAGTQPELWLTFLDRIFDSDADMIAFIQRAAGYALTGSVVEHKLLFLYGTGRNGKSVFLNTLMGIWGDYARRAPASVYGGQLGHFVGLSGVLSICAVSLRNLSLRSIIGRTAPNALTTANAST